MLEPFRSIAFWGSIPFALAVSWVGFRAARFLARRQGWPEPARRVERGFIAMLTTGIATAVYINHLGDDAGLIGRLAKGLDRLESTAYWLYGMPFALWAGLAVRQRWFAPPAGRELMKVSQPRRRGLLVLLSVTTCVTAWSITNVAPTSEQIVAGIGAIGLILSFVTGFGRPLRMTENGIQRPMLAVLRWDDIRSCRMEHTGDRNFLRIEHSGDRHLFMIPKWLRSDLLIEVQEAERPAVEALLRERLPAGAWNAELQAAADAEQAITEIP